MNIGSKCRFPVSSISNNRCQYPSWICHMGRPRLCVTFISTIQQFFNVRLHRWSPSLLALPLNCIIAFCIILRHLRVQLAEKPQSTEPKQDRFLSANVPLHLCATVSWQPPPADAGMFAVTVFSTQWYTGSIGRRRHPHQILRHCIFDDTPCMQLTLWRTHKHTHTHSLRSPPCTPSSSPAHCQHGSTYVDS